MFESILKKRLEPTVITFSSAISACEKAGQWKEALKLLAMSRVSRVFPNVVTYNASISACAGKNGEWEQAMQLFWDMMLERLRHNNITYNAVVAAVAEKAGEWQRALGSSVCEAVFEVGSLISFVHYPHVSPKIQESCLNVQGGPKHQLDNSLYKAVSW